MQEVESHKVPHAPHLPQTVSLQGVMTFATAPTPPQGEAETAAIMSRPTLQPRTILWGSCLERWGSCWGGLKSQKSPIYGHLGHLGLLGRGSAPNSHATNEGV